MFIVLQRKAPLANLRICHISNAQTDIGGVWSTETLSDGLEYSALELYLGDLGWIYRLKLCWSGSSRAAKEIRVASTFSGWKRQHNALMYPMYLYYKSNAITATSMCMYGRQ